MQLIITREISIPVEAVTLYGSLVLPKEAKGIIVFSHGSGSSSHSIRNRMVAERLHESDFGTLLFDLLTPAESEHIPNRFDIPLLTKRILGALEWVQSRETTKHLPLGIFGASTGAASALNATAYQSGIGAIVCRGGRTDLAYVPLDEIEVPTMFIVGSDDFEVLELNRISLRQMHCDKRLEIVEGATHLFEEVGAMQKVADLATNWFKRYLITQ